MCKYVLGLIINTAIFLVAFYLLLLLTNIESLVWLTIIGLIISIAVLEANRILFKDKGLSGDKIFPSGFNVLIAAIGPFVFSLFLHWLLNAGKPIAIVIAIMLLPSTFAIFKSEFPSSNNLQKNTAGVLAMIQTALIWFGMFKIYTLLRM